MKKNGGRKSRETVSVISGKLIKVEILLDLLGVAELEPHHFSFWSRIRFKMLRQRRRPVQMPVPDPPPPRLGVSDNGQHKFRAAQLRRATKKKDILTRGLYSICTVQSVHGSKRIISQVFQVRITLKRNCMHVNKGSCFGIPHTIF
jgi:hypothetical protein